MEFAHLILVAHLIQAPTAQMDTLETISETANQTPAAIAIIVLLDSLEIASGTVSWLTLLHRYLLLLVVKMDFLEMNMEFAK